MIVEVVGKSIRLKIADIVSEAVKAGIDAVDDYDESVNE